MPDWLEGLRHLGEVGGTEALLTPLPTFRSAPKGTAEQLGDLFADLGEELLAWPAGSDEEAHLWRGIHCFSRWLLWAPTGGLPAHAPAAQREAVRRDAVLGRVSLARAGRWNPLARTAQKEAETSARRRANSPLPAGLGGKALANEVQRRVHKGEWRSAASLLQSRGVAPPTEETRQALAQKLVGGPSDRLAPRERPTHRGSGLDRDSLYKALSSAPSASAPGPSGMRFSHLQTFKAPPRALGLLGGLCDRIADGDVPEETVDLLGLTKLTPLKKDGPGIRPVAAGECLRKLAARAW